MFRRTLISITLLAVAAAPACLLRPRPADRRQLGGSSSGARRPSACRRPRRRRPRTTASRSCGRPTAQSRRSTRSRRSTIRRTRSTRRCATRCCASSPTARSAPAWRSRPTRRPTKLVLNLRSGPRFWNGQPVTAADVVFSLERAASHDQRQLLLGGLQPRQVDRRDQRRSTVTLTLSSSPTTGCRASSRDGGDRAREVLRREGGQEVRHAPGR